jgi:hypothetical protein
MKRNPPDNAVNTPDIVKKLQQFSSCLEIVHHVPGRIRLRLLLDGLPSPDAHAESLIAKARAFKDTLDDIPGIRSIRVNALARSCTIEYDHRDIPFQAWPDFLGCVPSEAAAVLQRILSAKYTEADCA